MEAVLPSSQGLYLNEITQGITINKYTETKTLCQGISETSPAYNVTTIGKYIILSPCDIYYNYNQNIKTYVEVDVMKQKVNSKIYNIYNSVIILSLILILFSILNLAYGLLNISNHYSIAIAICAFIGGLSVSIDKYEFTKDENNE